MSVVGSVIQAQCRCGAEFGVKAAAAGKVICPKCGRTFDPNAPESGTKSDPTTDPALMADPAEWQVGDVYLDLYEVMELLGEGGMGKVHRVRHREWDVDLAVKSPNANLLGKLGGAAKFEQECETWINLGLHPYTVSCFYVRQIGNIPRIFSEYVSGGTLLTWLWKKRLYKGGLEESAKRIYAIATQVAWGLQHAHNANLIHRDIKPANIMMTPEGAAKITDFGLAAGEAEREAYNKQMATADHRLNVAMTPKYCSPEQFEKKPLDFKSDMWSWALLVLQMYTMKITWRVGSEGAQALEDHLMDGPPEAYIPIMPNSVSILLRQCLSRNPADRPESMDVCAAVMKDAYEFATDTPFPFERPRAVEAQADHLNNRAVSMIDLSRTEQAAEAWQKALSVSPAHPESTFNFGLVEWRRGRVTDDALISKMEEICTLHPGSRLPQLLLARAHIEQGDYGRAETIINDVDASSGPLATEFAAAKTLLAQDSDNGRRIEFQIDGHVDTVTCISTSDNPRYAVSGGEDNTVRYWDLVSGECLRSFEGHRGSVRAVALSRDNARVLSGGNDRVIKVWDTETGECIQNVECKGGEIHALQWSRNSDIIAVAAGRDGFYTYRTRGGKFLAHHQVHSSPVTTLILSLNRRYALSGDAKGVVKLSELATHKVVRDFREHTGPITGLALRADGSLAVSSSEDGTISLWDVRKGSCIRTLKAHKGPVTDIAMDVTGLWIVSTGADGRFRLWYTPRGQCVMTLNDFKGPLNAVALNSDGTRAAMAGKGKTLHVFRTQLGHAFERAHLTLCVSRTSEAVLSEEDEFQQYLAQARDALKNDDLEGAVKGVREARAVPGYSRKAEAIELWQELYTRLPRRGLTGSWEAAALRHHTGPVNALSFDPRSRTILTGGQDGLLKHAALPGGKLIHTLAGHPAPVTDCKINRDGTFALSSSDDGAIFIWDLRSGHHIVKMNENGGAVQSVAWSPNGQLAVSGGWEIKVWDLDRKRCLRSFEGHAAGVSSVAFTTDGRYIVSGGADNAVRVWDVATGTCQRTLEGHTSAISALALSGDNQLAVSGSGHVYGTKGELKVWALSTGRPLRNLMSNAAALTSLSLSLDGKYVVSAESDGAVKLWDVASSECLRSFEGNKERVECVRISQDGRYVATAGHDDGVRVWVLDWDLEEKGFAQWDRRAAPFLQLFLQGRMGYGLSQLNERSSERDLAAALTATGKPRISEPYVAEFFHTLGCLGLGWIKRESVVDQLKGYIV